MSDRGSLRVATPAKVNLGLEIIGRRDDGYHEIVTVMQSVAIYDYFDYEPDLDSFSYRASITELGTEDIVRKVLGNARDHSSWKGRLTLDKHIPIAAGLGGGSSDAATALRIAHPEANEDDLHHRAAGIGSDVPFFLHGGTALATGTGVQIHHLPYFDAWYVIVCPELKVESKTARLYQGLQPGDFGDGTSTMNFTEGLAGSSGAPDIPSNAFERQMRQFSSVERAWQVMQSKSSAQVNLSGAGPSIYAQFMNYESAIALYEQMRQGYETYLCRSTGRLNNRQQIGELARAIRTGIMSD